MEESLSVPGAAAETVPPGQRMPPQQQEQQEADAAKAARQPEASTDRVQGAGVVQRGQQAEADPAKHH
jgi:hypothetical protein